MYTKGQSKYWTYRETQSKGGLAEHNTLGYHTQLNFFFGVQESQKSVCSIFFAMPEATPSAKDSKITPPLYALLREPQQQSLSLVKTDMQPVKAVTAP